MALKTFITEMLFINRLETVFLVQINEFRQKCAYEGLVILLVNGRSMHMTLPVTAFCWENHIILIRLVEYMSHISQPLDLCVFGIFNILYKKEKQTKGMKGEIWKIYRALLSFYNGTIIPMVR
jgi:hypothetical protein